LEDGQGGKVGDELRKWTGQTIVLQINHGQGPQTGEGCGYGAMELAERHAENTEIRSVPGENGAPIIPLIGEIHEAEMELPQAAHVCEHS
jgi:hypothetical protein